MSKKNQPNKVSASTNVENSKTNKEATEPVSTILKLSEIVASELNHRKYFEPQSIKELADDIKKIGVTQPITVRPKGDKFEIVAGERRYRASIEAGKDTIPAIIRDLTDDEAIDIGFSENIHRKDVLAMEEARMIKYYIEVRKESFKSLSIRLSKSEVYVRTRYTLNNLIDPIQELLDKDVIQVGIAVLLASYEAEIQENVYDEHLNKEYNSWLDFSYSKFSKRLEQEYTSNLKEALFDTTDCQTCISNSGAALLFGEDNPRCLKPLCFKQKKMLHATNQVITLIESNPLYFIVMGGSVPEFITKAMEEKGFKFDDRSQFKDFSTYPEKPDEINIEDYRDEETGEIDEDWYKGDLETYNEEMASYNAEITEIEQNLSEGIYKHCFIVNPQGIEKGYCEMTVEAEPQEETVVDEVSGEEKVVKTFIAEKKKLKELEEKDTRNFEISIENSVKDIKELFKTTEITPVPINEMEEYLFYVYLANDTPTCNKKFIDKDYGSIDLMFDRALKFTDDDKEFIKREFIKKQLCHFAYNATSHSTKYMLQFAIRHFPKETEEITNKYDEVYKKRQESIEKQRSEIQSYIDDEKGKAEVVEIKTPVETEVETIEAD